MNYFIKYFIYILAFLFLTKCSQPIILKNNIETNKGLFQFGNTSDRNFYYEKNISPDLELIWSNETYGSFSNSSMLLYDKFLFVPDLSGRLFVFNKSNGKLVGYEKFSGEIAVTPIINSFRIYIPINKKDEINFSVITFDFLNGKILNEVKLNGKISFEMIKVQDGFVVFSSFGEIIKFNFLGEIDWKEKFNFDINSNGIIKNNLCFFGNNKSELIIYDLVLRKIIKKINLTSNVTSGIAIDNNDLFFSNEEGSFVSINYLNETYNWKVKTKSKSISFPVHNTNKIITSNLSGELICIEKESGKIIWNYSSNGLFNSTPILFDNIILIPDNNKRILLINSENGNVISSLEFERRVKLSPLYFDGIIYFGIDRGIINAYKVNSY
ncbi:MAG: PQQ-binding-like beta-propeller repeat protein [Melioribacteraceae bacterium]|nr:PQQ-binding-like beta-propeller repeat protein [Melioribacteraceae bacterium]